MRGETPDELGALPLADVDGDGLLVPPERPPHHRRLAAGEPPAPDLVADPGLLDLDHFGAELAEQPPRSGRRDEVAELQHPDTQQRRATGAAPTAAERPCGDRHV